MGRSAFVFLLLLVARSYAGTLYGYYQANSKTELVSIDITTGAATKVCDLSSVPVLAGAAATTVGKTLNFYTEMASASPISLVQVTPSTCKSNVVGVSGLGLGQNDVRDFKVNYKTGEYYMVLPNPNCMHGSLDRIDSKSGKVMNNLLDMVDPEGLNVQSGISPSGNIYYSIGLPFPTPADVTTAQINAVDLVSGNLTSIGLTNDNVALGTAQNYTMGVFDKDGGTFLIGAISPASSMPSAGAKSCSPSGFFSVNAKTGNVTCAFGPVNMRIALLAEVDYEHNYLYQVFLDSKGASHLVTFDVVSSKIVTQTPCPLCGSVATLAYVA